MNAQELEEIDYIEEDDLDIDRHYIKSINLAPGCISIEDKKFIMDSMVHGDRVFFDGLTESSKSQFMVRIFSRYASDFYIEKYLDEEFGYEISPIKNMLDKEEDSCQVFLNRFANVPDIILDNNARSMALSRLKKEYLKQYQKDEVDRLMEPFQKMTTDGVVTFYQKNYLK